MEGSEVPEGLPTVDPPVPAEHPEKFSEDDISDADLEFQAKDCKKPAIGPKTEDNLTKDKENMRYLREMFKNFGAEKGAANTHRQFLVEPVVELEKPARFSISASDDVGKVFQVRMLKQWPHQQTADRPLFELEESFKAYEDMNKKMAAAYTTFISEPTVQEDAIMEDLYYVLLSFNNDGSSIYNRIKVLRPPIKFDDGTIQAIEVELIDQFFKKTFNPDGNVLWLDEAFTTLPPRVTAIEMEGMSNYKGSEQFRRFIRYDSDEYLFEGMLQAEVQPSGKVVVWSDRFPKEKFPYGINGFITLSILELMGPRNLSLPPAGCLKHNVYVVQAEPNGCITLQFKNDISHHWLELGNSIPYEKMISLKGGVKLPLTKKDEIYFAPHEVSGGTYYRAVVTSSDTPTTDKVHVKFIDYGDKALVNVEDLVRAEEVHYLFPLLPPISVPAHLANILTLDTDNYMKTFHSADLEFTAYVVKEATKDSPAEVEVIRVMINAETDEDDAHQLCVNEDVLKLKLGTPMDPNYEYQGKTRRRRDVEDEWATSAKLYLGLGNGQRLHVGDELRVQLQYQKGIEANLFITPAHRIKKEEELGTSLENYFKLPWVKKRELYVRDLRAGQTYLLYSPVVKQFCRGVLISEKRLKNEDDTLVVYWKTYLMDYGILEMVPFNQLIYTKPEHMNLPALGIRITHKMLPDKKATRAWWKSTLGLRGGFQTLDTTIKVNAISKDEYGEIAEVEFPLLKEIKIKEEVVESTITQDSKRAEVKVNRPKIQYRAPEPSKASTSTNPKVVVNEKPEPKPNVQKKKLESVGVPESARVEAKKAFVPEFSSPSASETGMILSYKKA